MFEFGRSTKLAEGMLVKTGVAAALGEDPVAMASSTSALMILPFGPVPWMPARLTPEELARFWARGLAKILLPDGLAAAGAETGVAGAGVDGAAAGVGAAGVAATGAAVVSSATKSLKAAISSSSSTRIANTLPSGTSLEPAGYKIFAR